MTLQLEVHTDATVFHLIRNEWEILCDCSLTCTPFQYPQWIIPWWNCFGGSKLKALVIRDDHELIAFAPFFIYLYNSEVRKCCLAGAGISDYQDIPIRIGREKECVTMILNYLWDIRSEWDQCVFSDINEHAIIYKEMMSGHFTIQKMVNNVCLAKNIVDKSKPLLSQVPKKLRNNIRRFEKKLFTEGVVTFIEEPECDLDKAIKNLISLHSARWNSKNCPGVLSDENVCLFHHNASKLLYKKKLLKIFSLYLNNKLIASYYILMKNIVAYAYIGGIAPEMVNYSPGTLALYYVVKSMIEDGYTCFDFLRGEEEYKKFWSPIRSNNYQIELCKP